MQEHTDNEFRAHHIGKTVEVGVYTKSDDEWVGTAIGVLDRFFSSGSNAEFWFTNGRGGVYNPIMAYPLVSYVE